MENELVYKDLSYMEVLRNYSFESKMLVCQKYASRIMDISEVSMSLAYRQNIMPWELESFTSAYYPVCFPEGKLQKSSA